MVLRVPDSWSNWNLEMLVFEEKGKLEKNLSEQRREPTTNSTHQWCWRQDSNPGHIDGRRVLSPLHRPCYPKFSQGCIRTWHPRLLPKENRRKIEPKEIPSGLIPCPTCCIYTATWNLSDSRASTFNINLLITSLTSNGNLGLPPTAMTKFSALRVFWKQ